MERRFRIRLEELLDDARVRPVCSPGWSPERAWYRLTGTSLRAPVLRLYCLGCAGARAHCINGRGRDVYPFWTGSAHPNRGHDEYPGDAADPAKRGATELERSPAKQLLALG